MAYSIKADSVIRALYNDFTKVLRGIPIEDFDAKERELGPQLYEGLTPEAYAAAVRKFKALPVWGFENMTYGEAYFQPMVSLVKYLYEHDYNVYIVSATYRDAVRVMTEGVLDKYIPYDHVIGTDLLYVASGDEAEDSMFYELEPSYELVIAGELFIKNQKTNKATVIQQEIGKMPVLAFGNSTGDFSMATYTLQNDKYGGRAYMLLCDDTERDYGDAEVAAAILNHEPLPSSPRSTAQMAAESFAGFTVEEYQAYVREFLQQDVPGFEGMTYGSRFFVPMVELVRYLAGHDFQVYLCSDTERDYGDMAEAEEFAAECAALGFETVSMRDEFETIYAEGIEKAEDAALQPAA